MDNIMDTADKLIQCVNRGDGPGQLALATDDCMVHFEYMAEMPWRAYVKANEEIKASFPDFSISVPLKKEVFSGNKIRLSEVFVSGKHTGVAYGLANTPNFPRIEPTGMAVRNDPETFEFTIEAGKITAFKIFALGAKSGPPGLYDQVAGLVF
jgi:hypothetical protein